MSKYRRARALLRDDGPRGLAAGVAAHLRWTARTSAPGVRLRRWRYARRADGVDPFRLSAVDPDRVAAVTGGIAATEPGAYHLERVEGFDPAATGFGAVRDGDWDRSGGRFDALAEYEALRAVVEDGVDWTDTELYARHADRIAAGHESFGCESVAALAERLAAVDDLRRRIERDGYRARRADGADPFDEIRVNVGRDGRLLYNDEGRHRLAIAKLLDVERVPVLVVARHADLVYP